LVSAASCFHLTLGGGATMLHHDLLQLDKDELAALVIELADEPRRVDTIMRHLAKGRDPTRERTDLPVRVLLETAGQHPKVYPSPDRMLASSIFKDGKWLCSWVTAPD
jgi:hypothetical protein